MSKRRSSREGELLAGKYKLVKLLGVGGMGEVYEAENTMIGRSVAIKMLREEHAENADIVARFLREARAANIVRHPNVVDVLDIGQDEEGAPFIVQELLEGEDLGGYMESLGGRVPVDAVLDLLLPVMDAVAFAHAKNVVHRDLKPENIFLSRVGPNVVPKVLDFGIARITTAEEKRMTATGVSMGTPAYMSPEQINDNRGIDARSDVWAFGVILHEVISGELPFHAETFSSLFVKIATEPPIPLETAFPAAPKELAAIVARCLRRNPAERYPHAGELAAALRKARALGPIMIPTATRKSVPAPEMAHAPTQSAAMPAARAQATVVPDLNLPAPKTRAPSPPALAMSAAPSSSSTRAAPPPAAPMTSGLDPFDDEVQHGSGLAIENVPSLNRIQVPAEVAARQRAAKEAAERRREAADAKNRVVGIAILALIALVLTGVLSTLLASANGWPTVTWASHMNGLPLPMTATAAITLLVVGLVCANEGYRAIPVSWGLFAAAAGLLVDAFATCGFFVSSLPNLAGPAAPDEIVRAVFPWATMVIPLGLAAHAFRRATYAWSDDARGRGIALSVAVAFSLFAALQIARGASAGPAPAAITRAPSGTPDTSCTASPPSIESRG